MRKTSFEPGKRKISDAEYHADAAISSTQLVEACRSPAHFWAISTMNPAARPRPDTDDLLIGRAVHCRILEPKDFSFFYRTAPQVNKRTKVGKEEFAEFERFVEEQGATAITPEQRDLIDAMAAALEVQELETDTGRIIRLADIFRTGEAEQAYFWKDAETGLDCRCKADWMTGNILLDYKSTRDARYHQFRRQVGGLRYHMRAAFYIDGITAATGKAPSRFILLAQEKTYPFCAAPYQLLEADIEQGRTEYRRALRSIAEAIEKGRFDGYSRKVQDLSIPDYLYDQ